MQQVWVADLTTKVIQYSSWTMQQKIEVVNYTRQWGVQNVLGAQVYIPSAWNLQLASQLATSASDREVVKYLTFGWPLDHDGRETTITLGNHALAEKYPQQVGDYILKEVCAARLIGPLVTIPWTSKPVVISPMSTRPKRDSHKRQIIVDLSWPQNSMSVNDGIDDDTYMGQQM